MTRRGHGGQSGSLYGAAVTRKGGNIIHASKFGTDLAMHSAAPPPVEEYDKFLRTRNVPYVSTDHNRTQKTGFRLRRIVIMRRAGSSWKECGEAVGVSGSCARDWVEFLPLALAV